MRNLFLAFLVLLLGTHSVFSQISFQKLDGISGNANLSYILGDQNGNLYAVTDGDFSGANGLIYRSQNNGETWQKLNTAFRYVRITPDGILFGFKSYQLYRSVDQGENWTVTNDQIPVNPTFLEVTPNGTLLYRSSSKLNRSTDGGISWTEVSIPFNDAEKILGGTDGFVYAFHKVLDSEMRTYRSADEGQTWQLVGSYPDNYTDYYGFFQTQSGRLMLLKSLSNGFYYSDDHGATWANYPLTNAGAETPRYIIQTSSGRLWLITTNKRFYSDDDGTTWINGNISTYSEPLQNIFLTPDNHIWGNFQGALYRTDDANLQTWTFAADGMEEPNVVDIQTGNDSNLYVATTGGLFRSNDNGNNWTHFYKEPIIQYAKTHFCFDQDGNIILANDYNVWRIDAQTGSRANITPDENPLYNLFFTAFCLPNGDLLVSGGSDGTNISHDNGITWTVFNFPSFGAASGAGAGPITGVEIVTDSVIYMYSLEGESFQYNPLTLDIKFVPWHTQHPGTSVLNIGLSGSIHIASYNQYCFSPDFGTSWECYNLPNYPFSPFGSMLVNSVGSVFMSDVNQGKGIYESVDGGQSWNNIYKDPNNRDVTLMRLSASEYIYMAVQGKGLHRSTTSTSSQPIIKGSVFNDANLADCDRDATEQKVIQIKTRLESNGTTYVGVSNLYGQYAMPALTGDLTAEAIPPSNYWEACQKSLNVPVNATGIINDSLGLGLQPLVQCPKMEVSLSSPFLRRCFESYLVVNYCNTGTLPATNATVEVTLDSFFVFESADALLLAQNGRKLTFQIGDVDVNHCGQFKILVTVSCEATLGQSHCSYAHIYPDQDCMNTWNGSWLETSAECTAAGLTLTINNRGAAMQAPTSYIATHTTANGVETSQEGTVQLLANASFTLNMPDLNNVVFFSVQQENGFPYGTAASLLTSGCDASESSFSVQHYADNYAWEDEECIPNVGSFDPNDKSAFPPGFGEADYLPHGQTIEYQVRFQNTGTDTAFTVVVRDQISPWLDLTTVRPIASSHPYLFEINGQELVFRFPHINLPDSNINEATSHGFLRFTITPRTELPDGVEIANQARIYFDFNDPVITNTTHYTLGIPFVTNTKESYSLPALTVSPNPSSGLALIELPASIQITNGQTLHVTDMAGREIYQQPIEGNRIGFNLPQLASGLYLLSVRAKDGQMVAAGKWVKN